MASSFPLDVNHLREVLDRVNLGVYVTDLERRIVLWNRKAEEITGYRAEDVVGRACHDQVLRHVDQHGHALCSSKLCPLHRAMALNRESAEPVLVFARKADGDRVVVSVSVAPLCDEGGNVVGGIETFRDETGRINDLEFAKQIQRNLLPAAMPDGGGYAFEVRYYPHDLIGGDFYDVTDLGDGRFGLLMADVRGHGVSAALYTMWLKSLAESCSDSAADPGAFLSNVNRELSKFVVEESFATAVYAVFDCRAHRFAYVNAGHPPPLLLQGRETRELEAQGLPLGIVGEEEYAADEVPMNPGDLLLCYTDGVTEAAGKDGDMLGQAGLEALLREEAGKGEANLLERLYRRIVAEAGNVQLKDDVTMLSARREDVQ